MTSASDPHACIPQMRQILGSYGRSLVKLPGDAYAVLDQRGNAHAIALEYRRGRWTCSDSTICKLLKL